MRASVRTAASVLAASLVLGSAVACSHEPGPETAVDAYAKAWGDNTLDKLTFVAAGGGSLSGAQVAKEIHAVAGDLADRRPTLRRQGTPAGKGDDVTATVTMSWPLADGVTWTYPVRLPVHHDKRGWRVVWSTADVHPDLGDGESLLLRRVTATRGTILDGAGRPLVAPRPVVTISVQPREVTSVPALVSGLGTALKVAGVDVDLSGLPKQIAARSTAPIEVVTLRREAYQRIRDRIHDLPGLYFAESDRPLAPNRTFARALLGTVGDVQKDRMDAHPGRYVIGDQVGYGGIQERYDDRLRGSDGIRVLIEPAAKDEDPREVFKADPRAGEPVKTTLDVATQNAADAALATEKRPAALVAVRISDGAVLAVANGPDGGSQDLALTAAVPPGSTFKMVTAEAVLDNGSLTPASTVECPRTLTIDGRSFKNSHDMALGRVPFHTDFARSCNTAFASLAGRMGPDGLSRAAAALGIGGDWDLGMETFTGKVSTGGSASERAAAAFGQGTTVVSPVAMAAAAAAVARGRWQAPSLVADPAGAKKAPDGAVLKPTVVRDLKSMMREVVTSGTATGVRDVPGAPISGKTGTAEYDNNPDHAHSWFIGFRGDVAFACFVQGGGMSTDAAVPIVGRFFTRLG